jgi:hypothetical protein
MNLGASPPAAGSLSFGAPQGQQNGFAQQNPFGQQQAMGMGMGGMNPAMNPYGGMQQPMQPPSEIEIMLALLQSTKPVETWITSVGFQNFVQMVSLMMERAVVEFFRNAVFKKEDDDTFKVDMTAMPSHWQTLSDENIVNEFSGVRNAANQELQNAQMMQQQIMTMTQQAGMQGALGAALADEGTLKKIGGGMGSFLRAVK